MKQGKVWLVGAGPGDEGLLTVKAKQLIERADVVVYDALVGKSILAGIPSRVELLYVGKRASHHTLPQKEINHCLVEYARQGKNVVRLKGGDPFLFGRGGEEIEELHRQNIDFEVVPGVPSALAVPAYNGIPVTHRDYCSCVHIITGHKKNGERLDMDFEALCRLGGTLVFLMGTSALGEICQGLLLAGMSPDTPAALLSRGTTAGQQKVLASLATLEEQTRHQQPKTPAIIVVGQVCALSQEFAWYETLPLSGMKVVVTRPRQRSRQLVEKLRQLGAEVFEIPTIVTTPISDNRLLQEKLQQISMYQWLVFTSPTGVDIFFEECYQSRFDIRQLSCVKIAVIGEGTRKQLEKKGLQAQLMPPVYQAGALGRVLADRLNPGDHILIPRAKEGSRELLQELDRKNNVVVDDVPTYETTYPGIAETIRTEIAGEGQCITVFTSASTVKGYIRSMEGTDFTKVYAACIGEQTGREARHWGMKTFVAEKATVDSLVDLVLAIKRGWTERIDGI